MAFKRPGSISKTAFGLAYEKPRSEPPAPAQPAPAREDDPIQQARRALPVYRYRTQILYLIEHHATTLLVGETGSGKTTQLPQYLHEAGWTSSGYQVVCTQPRRVAAASIAARVAEETGTQLGHLVGYAVRFEEACTQGVTKIKYVTDGVLLREMLDDPLLSAYSVVVVDEAHERSLATDTLLGLLKKVQRRRADLRVVISSATLEVARLAAFFNSSSGSSSSKGGISRSPAVLSVEGRTHPVQVHYSLEPVPDYVRAAVETAVKLHKEDVPGDVLLFLTGQEEVEAAVRLLQQEAQHLARSRLKYKMMPLPLYAGLPGAQQRQVFAPTPRGQRKVVAATNVAETSLTLEGVVHVVDCCHVKQRCYNPLLGLESLLVAPISKASAAQRAGRAGRLRPGHCFRLCTEESFQQLAESTVPEMQRSELGPLVLQLKALGVDNIMTFEWLSPPPAEAMVRALEGLHALGALDGDAKLTKAIGLPLSLLPLDPPLGRCLLKAGELGCTEELATIAALLSVGSIWWGGGGARRQQEAARAKFGVAEGDLVSYLNVFRAWQGQGARAGAWCQRHYLRHGALLCAAGIREQLMGRVRGMGVVVESCGSEVIAVQKAITAGMFMNAAVYESTEVRALAPEGDPGTHVYRLLRGQGSGSGSAPVKLRMHATSVLARVRPQWVVFHSVQQGEGGWHDMQGVTPVEPSWLLEAAPHMFSSRQRQVPA